jgi:hypothetical protein
MWMNNNMRNHPTQHPDTNQRNMSRGVVFYPKKKPLGIFLYSLLTFIYNKNDWNVSGQLKNYLKLRLKIKAIERWFNHRKRNVSMMVIIEKTHQSYKCM